jgi:hypothetical protein
MNKKMSEMPQSKKSIQNPNVKGYGVAFLVLFVATSILMAVSISLLTAPSTGRYVGTLALDEATAKQLAEEALDAAQSDILSKQASNTTIDTSYRYPSSGANTISLPTYPSSGSTVVKGSYYVTATYARGITFVLKATVSVGTNNMRVSNN